MKPDYIKIAAITFAVLFTSFLGYGSYKVIEQLSKQSDLKANLKNKEFPFSTIYTMEGQAIDSNVYHKQTKMVVYVSTHCSHCLRFLEAFKEDNNFLKDNIFPVFTSELSTIDSFSKVNNLTDLKLYQIKKNRINKLVKTVPTFLITDSTNKIKNVYSGLPRMNNNDSLITYVYSLFTKNNLKTANLPTESCH